MARGDHIMTRRWRGLYTHHGIDMGDGTVVHFSGEPLRLAKAAVVRETIEVFSCGAPVAVVEYADSPRSVEEVVESALSKIGEAGYRLAANNCEHFATWCKTGRKQSPQVRRVVKAAALAAVAGVAVAAASRQRGMLAGTGGRRG